MGPIEESTRLNVSALSTTHPMFDALAKVAYRLAASMDSGSGLMEAATSRELRAVLTELSSMSIDDDDSLAADLSTPLGDPQN